jgi:vitamin B12 transporter
MKTRFPLFAALTCVATIAGAQASSDTAKVTPMVVTATRAPVTARAVPASVTVLMGDDLRARGIGSVVDALREVPGVAIAQTGSFGGQTSLFMRGGQSSYTKVLLDGVPVNQSGGAFDFATLTTDNVERIEVLRGPGSVVWGSDAVTGVINVITRVGGKAGRASVAARAGTYGSMDADATVFGLGTSASYSLGLARHQTDGIYDFNNRYESTVLSGRTAFFPDARTDGAVSVRYTDYAAHYPTDGSGIAVDSNAFRSETRLALGVDVGRRFTDRLMVRASLNTATADGGTDNAEDVAGGSWGQSLDHVARRSVDLRALVDVAAGVSVTVGGTVEEQTQRSQSQSGGSFSYTSLFNASRRNRGGYVELLATRERWTGTLGYRVDDNAEFGTFGTYRVAGRYAVTGTTTVRASVGTGYREPSFFEHFSTAFTVGNPDLNPEHSASAEVGLSQTLLDGRLTVSAVHFDQTFRDMIDYDGSSPFPNPNYFNRARATSRGQELEVQATLPRGLTAMAAFTHLDTRVGDAGFSASPTALLVKDSSLLRRPGQTLVAGLGYSRAGVGTVHVRATRVGERGDRYFAPDFTTDAVTLPAYTLIDLSADMPLPSRFRRGGTAPVLTFRGSNLGDAEYESISGYRSPRRMFLVGVRVGF